MSGVSTELTSLGLTWAWLGLPLAWAGAHLWLRRKRRMKIVTVIDGDTVAAIDPKGRKFRLRLRGIDCPEIGQSLGAEARQALAEVVAKQWVHVRLHGRDRYRRHVADVWTPQGQLAQAVLVRAGLAHVLEGHWRLQWLQWPARLRLKGVHAWGQKKPWAFRGPRWLRWLKKPPVRQRRRDRG